MQATDLIAPEYFNLAEAIDRHAAEQGDKIAVLWENEQGETRRITYRELRDVSNQLANAMKDLGLAKGDKVIIILPKIIENYVSHLAALKLGLVISPGTEMLRPADLLYRINNSQAKAVIMHHSLIERIDEIRQEASSLQYFISVDGTAEGWEDYEKLVENSSSEFKMARTRSDDIAFLNYTSGTTGDPKGVLGSHQAYYCQLAILPKWFLDIRDNDIVWATSGPGWVAWQIVAFLSTLGGGATGVSYLGRFDPVKHLEIVQKYKVNTLYGAATEFRRIAKLNHLSDYNLPHLRNLLSTGEPLNRYVYDTFKKYFGIEVRDAYGQTEASMIIGNLTDAEIKPGSLGKPLVGSKVAIIDEKDNPVPAGEIGEIAIHRSSPFLFKEYLNDPERTAAAYRNEWYVTKDLGKMDVDGYFWYEGRADDVIISSGYTIGPSEIEDALMKHSKVQECAVVASPDETRGSIVKAFIILKDKEEASQDLVGELQEHVKSITAPYKYPREIEFIDELPKTVSGKVRKVELRRWEQLKKIGEHVN